MTQDELAALAGAHRTYISGIETGFRNPTIDVVFALAAALRCSSGELMPDRIPQ